MTQFWEKLLPNEQTNKWTNISEIIEPSYETGRSYKSLQLADMHLQWC